MKNKTVLISPSLHSQAKELCEDIGLNLNVFIERAIERAIEHTNKSGILLTRNINNNQHTSSSETQYDDEKPAI